MLLDAPSQLIFSFFLGRKIVLVAVQDSSARFVKPALPALRFLGAYRVRPTYRGSYALIGITGSGKRPFWVKQSQHGRRRGPSALSVAIPLGRLAKPCMYNVPVLR